MTYTVKELIIIRNIVHRGEPNTAKDKVKKYKILKNIGNTLQPYIEVEKESSEEELEDLYSEEEDVEKFTLQASLLPDDIEMKYIAFLDNKNLLE